MEMQGGAYGIYEAEIEPVLRRIQNHDHLVAIEATACPCCGSRLRVLFYPDGRSFQILCAGQPPICRLSRTSNRRLRGGVIESSSQSSRSSPNPRESRRRRTELARVPESSLDRLGQPGVTTRDHTFHERAMRWLGARFTIRSVAVGVIVIGAIVPCPEVTSIHQPAASP